MAPAWNQFGSQEPFDEWHHAAEHRWTAAANQWGDLCAEAVRGAQEDLDHSSITVTMR